MRLSTKEQPSALANLRNYIAWLDTEPRQPFSYDNWLDEGSIVRLSDPLAPFSIAIDEKNISHSHISDQWTMVWKDTKFLSSTPFFTLGQTYEMVQRDNEP